MNGDKQPDAAEEVVLRAIDLLPEGEPFQACEAHRVLGDIYDSKGETEKAVHHFEQAIEIASSLRAVDRLFWILFSLAELFSGEGRFNDAHAHVEQAKSHAVNNVYLLARASRLQAGFWDQQHIFGEARSEALGALGVFEKLGAADDAEETRELLGRIDRNARGDELVSAIPEA